MRPMQSSPKWLYRIVRFDRLVQMFKTGAWHFAHPSAWEDPYEIRTTNAMSDRIFALCWCRDGVSDAMWRIYSPDRLGVRIRTRMDRLQTSLSTLRAERGILFRLQRIIRIEQMNRIHELRQRCLHAKDKRPHPRTNPRPAQQASDLCGG